MKSIAQKLALAAFVFSAASSYALVIDFNSLSGNQGTSFAVGAVTFSAAGTGGISASSTPNGTIGLLEESSPRTFIRATIAGGTSSVAVDLGDFNADADTIFLEIFNSSNVSLGFTSAALDASFSGMVTLSLSAANISYAVFGATAPSVNGSSVFADNFTYSTTRGVPEAGTTATLLGLSLLGLAAIRRKLS